MLHTDISVREAENLIKTEVQKGHQHLQRGSMAVLRSIGDDRLDLLRDIPHVDELVSKLVEQFRTYLKDCGSHSLATDDVSSKPIFDDYFSGRPPFSNPKKKNEFPYAFTLHRLAKWAAEQEAAVYVVGPDTDLKDFCEAHPPLKQFSSTVELLAHLNADADPVARLESYASGVERKVMAFVEQYLPGLAFQGSFYGAYVENAQVEEVDVEEMYPLEINDEIATVEVQVTANITFDYSYDLAYPVYTHTH